MWLLIVLYGSHTNNYAFFKCSKNLVQVRNFPKLIIKVNVLGFSAHDKLILVWHQSAFILFFTLLVNIMKNKPSLHLSILGGEHCFIGALSVFICTFCVGIRAIKTNALFDHLQRPAPLSYFCYI